jgi:Tol biopolymer transport system component
MPLSSSPLRRAFCLAALTALLATTAPASASRDLPDCAGQAAPCPPAASDTGLSRLPRLSGDGRYVVFESNHDLTHDGQGGLYRYDLLTGAAARVNVDASGRRLESVAIPTAISGDGDRVLFSAAAPGASPNAPQQLYVREFSTGRTILVSANTAGEPTAGWVDGWAVISADGLFVAFAALGGDLVPGDRPTASATEVYLRDLAAGTTSRASVGPAGLGQITQTNAGVPRVSTGGRYVAFTAIAGLVPDDTDNAQDVYVRDMQTGQLELVSRDSAGRLMPWSDLFGMSDDATRIFFAGADTDGSGAALYLRDRTTGTTRRLTAFERAAPQFGPQATLSGDGFVAAVQTSNPLGADDRDGRDDIILIDTRTGTVRPTTPDGMPDPPVAHVTEPSLSFDGSVLAVQTSWHHTEPTDPCCDVDSDKAEIFVFRAATGAWQRVTPPPAPAFPPPPPAPPGIPAGGPGPAPGAGASSGYWMVDEAGNVYPFGGAGWFGHGVAGTVDIEPTPAMDGYWLLDRTGRVTARGAAPALGHAALGAGEHATSLSATRSGRGYWIFTDTGRVFPFGDAVSYGDMAKTRLNGPVLGSVVTPTGRGYWMVAADGGIFAFGDARFAGSMGGRGLNQPISSMAPDPDGAGYWLVASDGGIFAFDAPFFGSMGGTRLNRPVTAMVPGAAGYLMVAGDGGIFAFGDVAFHGSRAANPPPRPVVAVALKRIESLS